MTSNLSSKSGRATYEHSTLTWQEQSSGHYADVSSVSERCQLARFELLSAARQWTRELAELAELAGVPASKVVAPRLTRFDASRPIVMTGHQPGLWHSGIAVKYETVDKWCDSHQMNAIALVIDTDEGDPLSFLTPEKGDVIDAEATHSPTVDEDRWGGLSLPARSTRQSFAQNTGLFLTGTVKPTEQITRIAHDAASQLRLLRKPDAAANLQRVAAILSRMPNCLAAKAAIVVRRALGLGRGLYEVPLSIVASLPSAQQLFRDIFLDAERFHRDYNGSLEEYRRSHGIDNPANPFPDLRSDGGRYELPFWLVRVDEGRRRPLWCEPQADGDGVASGDLVVPRHAMITSLMRMLFCDLFVHGTGGGTYDQFTDEFVRHRWNVSAAPVSVVTESRYLFEEQRDRLLRLKHVEAEIRNMTYHPEQFLDKDYFAPDIERQIVEEIQRKMQAVAALKELRAQQLPAAHINTRIQQATANIRQLAFDACQSQLDALRQLSKSAIDAIESREYPWFFFPDFDA
ncbi:MAG: hypothetical protein R3E01_35460 [Pirellulaceae bacterium]|nr:hypothetical protein [Planctomycetales bacterium]